MIHLYAEHLLNIRTLSIQAILSTVSNKETRATLSADGSILTLTHEGESASIKLPINLSPNRQSNITLTIPAVPSRELTFRVQLEEKEGVVNGVLSNGAPSESGNVVPWTANSLSEDTEIYCKSCGTVLVERGTVCEWKNLPSEGWAEMMEFWHCHKPDEPDQHDHAHSKKGYAANSQLALKSRVGMVNAMDFLLAIEDCQNVIMNDSPENAATTNIELFCSKCTAVIGEKDASSEGIRLRKFRLSLSIGLGNPPNTFDAEKWLTCLLLDTMENQGVRKILVREHGSISNTAMKLWLFSPDLCISSSVRRSPEYVRMAKTLWQDCESPQEGEHENLNGPGLSEGELRLQRGEIEILRNVLEKSSVLVPEGARMFQGWNVGLLERFTPLDLGPV